MTLTDLITSAQFVIDDQGHKKAVLLDFTTWTEIVTVLESLSAAEGERKSVDTLLTFAGTWVGDDLEQSLEDVYANRFEAVF
jgi:cobalamin biosynthesis Co2+ chelatase CbiK